MEGQSEPAEITHLKREFQTLAEDQAASGQWLAEAMASNWEVAKPLLELPELADQFGERHRIMANNWQAAQMSLLSGRLLGRAVDALEKVDFRAAGIA